MTAVVVEESVAAALPAPARAHLVIVPASASRARARGRRGGLWVPQALDVLAAARAGTLVLTRPPEADAGAARLRQLADLLDLAVVRLPEAAAAAAWVAAMAGAWVGAGQDGLLRRLQVLAAAAEVAALEGAGAAPGGLPAVRPPVLARWAGRAWHPCRWCRGGGLPTRCGTCGASGACGAVAP